MNEQKDCGCEKEGCNCMKHGHMCKKIIALILLVVLIFLGIKAFGHDGDKNAQQDTIVVNGKGELTVKPDIATISFSVTEENLDVSKASDAVNTRISKIMDTLKADGVAEADIKTTGYNIYPRYNYVNEVVPAGASYYVPGKQVLAGYDVTQSIEIKIRNLTNAGKVVTDLGTLKVTDMSGLTFTEDKYDDLVLQARDQAITDARVQATKLAKALGVKLVKIVSYSEGGTPTPVYYAAMNASASMKSAASAVLPTGENKITSNVSITYEIK
jgi:uncharacterized protein YggE